MDQSDAARGSAYPDLGALHLEKGVDPSGVALQALLDSHARCVPHRDARLHPTAPHLAPKGGERIDVSVERERKGDLIQVTPHPASRSDVDRNGGLRLRRSAHRMSRAIVWVLRAIVWMLRAIVW
eukprot:1195966-Prorocentrum_minimum.AAC.10